MRIHHTLLRPHGLGAESDWEQLGGEMRALAETKLKQDALLIEHEARSRVSAQLMRQQAIAEQSLQIRENAQGMREAVVVSGEEEKPEPYSMYLHRIYDELTQNELRATQNPFARAQLRKRFLSYGETLLHHGLEQERLALQRDTERRLSSLFQSAAHRVRFENVAETKKQMQSLIQNSDLFGVWSTILRRWWIIIVLGKTKKLTFRAIHLSQRSKLPCNHAESKRESDIVSEKRCWMSPAESNRGPLEESVGWWARYRIHSN